MDILELEKMVEGIKKVCGDDDVDVVLSEGDVAFEIEECRVQTVVYFKGAAVMHRVFIDIKRM